jgi:hypothetical protein
MRIPILLAALLAGSLHSQESKPANPRSESAPAAKPTEITALGKKVAIAIPANWSEAKAPSTFARDDWKAIKGWAHPSLQGCGLRVYGVEGKDLTPASVAQKWLDAAGKERIEVLVSVAGKNKTLKGLDTELEMNTKDGWSFYWMRGIAIPPKDKVLVVLAEVSPLDRGEFEAIVVELRSILDRLLDPSGKDPWRRDPNVTVTCGELVSRVTTPAGWEYRREGREGSLTWTDPATPSTHLFLGFPLRYARFKAEEAALTQFAPMLYKALVDAEAAMAAQYGRTLSTSVVPGHDQSSDTIMVTDAPEIGPTWRRRRLYLDGSNLVSLEATHGVSGVDAFPPDAVQKQVAAAMQSFKVEIVRGSK